MRPLLMFCPHLRISRGALKWLRVFRVCVRETHNGCFLPLKMKEHVTKTVCQLGGNQSCF